MEFLKSYFYTLYTNCLALIFPPIPDDTTIVSVTPDALYKKIDQQQTYLKDIDVTVHSAFSYSDETIKNMVHAFKYRRQKHCAPLFAEILKDIVHEDIAEHTVMYPDQPLHLIPIPISLKRYQERGFNQSELLAHALSIHFPDLLILRTDLLIRTYHTKSQARASNRAARKENIYGCFKVTYGSSVKDLHILLIDDIITTGATLEEASKTLREAGAKSIRAITIAH